MSDIKTRPQTKEFDEGYSRTFGDKKPQRGRWVYDEKQGKLVDAAEYHRAEAEAKYAPVMVDRWMEGTVSPVDGSDIGSRRKLEEHNKRNGVVMAADFEKTWAKKEAERARMFKDESYDDRSDAKRLEDRKRLYHRLSELERNPRRR